MDFTEVRKRYDEVSRELKPLSSVDVTLGRARSLVREANEHNDAEKKEQANQALIEALRLQARSKALRSEGFILGKIVAAFDDPKNPVHPWIRALPLDHDFSDIIQKGHFPREAFPQKGVRV